MKTNPKNFSRMIATSLALIAWPSLAQDTPAPADRPEAPKGDARVMREAGERLQKREAPESDVKPWRIGIMVEPIDQSLRNHLDIPEKSGVVVTQCMDQGPAARAGLKKKDIILSANGRPVGSIEPLKESVEASAKTGKELRLSVMTKGVRREVVIKPELPKPTVREPNADRTPDRSPGPRIVPQPTPPMSDAKLREHELMIRRMAEQNNQMKSQLERQQNEMMRTREAIEQLSKAVREMKQEMKEADKN